MGFTRYWYRQQYLPEQRFAVWATDVEALYHALPATYQGKALSIAGSDGTGLPTFSSTIVSFNGASGMSYEPFVVPQRFLPDRYDYANRDGLFFACCKTARMPYDLLVAAALLHLATLFGEVQVPLSADGPRDVWEDGQRLCEQVFGERAGFMPYCVWKKQYDAHGNSMEMPFLAYEGAVNDRVERGHARDGVS